MRTYFDKLLKTMTHPRFLSGEAAGAETPFYICPYPIEKSVEMDETVEMLSRKLEEEGIVPLKIDLFKLMISTMKENDDLDWTIDHEHEQSFYELRDDMHSILEEESVIAPQIAKILSDAGPCDRRIIFITNVGACYPVIRAHKLLNNLPSITERTPLVMFFPGEYCQIPGSGASLSLFGKLPGDGYYRAFNILEAQL